MSLWLQSSLRISGLVLFIVAAAYPWLRDDPIAQSQELAPWQQPSKLSALEQADQKKLLARLTYPHGKPELAPVPDFAAISDTAQRKAAFFAYLQPFIDRENARLVKLRTQLLELSAKQQQGDKLTLEEFAFIYSLFDEFKVDYPEVDAQGFKELLSKVDVLPVSLVLNQAAKESGWGSSRFAIEGFNFFGQWCFKSGCGFVPSKRPVGKYHEVAKFSDIAASINAYFYNLNTFYVYDDLRAIRAEIRQQGHQTDVAMIRGEKLAHGLKRYSERGDQYVTEIQHMIASNYKFMDES